MATSYGDSLGNANALLKKAPTEGNKMPELEELISSLYSELRRTSEVSNLLYNKIQKLKEEPADKCDKCPEPSKEPSCITEKLFDLTQGFRGGNDSLFESINKLEKLVG